MELLRRFKEILSVISYPAEVNIQNFRKFTLNTAKLYAETYPWYKMSTSVHVLLMHAWKIIDNLPGKTASMYSEEPIESSHKYMKAIREHNTRKTSR